MRFFVLIHSVSSYVCLKNLIEKGYIPGFVLTHEKYEREKLSKIFYTPVEKLCRKNKIKLIQSDNPKELINEIANYDVGICVGYMKILRKDLFDTPRYGIFNLHCGKLPEYRGRAPISRTIMNGDSDLIATLHKIDAGVDSGPIAIEMKIKITGKDDVNTLYKKFSENSYKSIVQLLKNLEKGKLNLKKQRKTKKAAHTVLTEDECRINWKKNADEIFNKVRALKAPYPQAFSIFKEKRYSINGSILTNINSKHKEGIIEKIKDNGIYVNAKDRLIIICEVSSDGKPFNLKKEFKAGDIFI